MHKGVLAQQQVIPREGSEAQRVLAGAHRRYDQLQYQGA